MANSTLALSFLLTKKMQCGITSNQPLWLLLEKRQWFTKILIDMTKDKIHGEMLDRIFGNNNLTDQEMWDQIWKELSDEGWCGEPNKNWLVEDGWIEGEETGEE